MTIKYLEDAWVNLSVHQSYNEIPEYFEWSKNDKVILYDQLACVKVSKSFMAGMTEYPNIELPKELFNKMNGFSYVRNGSRRIRDTAFVITDGNFVFVVKPDENGRVKYSGKLTPQHEAMVTTMLDYSIPNDYEYKNDRKMNPFVSPDSSSMIGLTRTEREKKKLIYLGIGMISGEETEVFEKKVRYLLSEFKNISYFDLVDVSGGDMIAELMELIEIGFNDSHENTLKFLVSSNSKLKEAFDAINERAKNYGVRS